MNGSPHPSDLPESLAGCGRWSLAGREVAEAGEQRPLSSPHLGPCGSRPCLRQLKGTTSSWVLQELPGGVAPEGRCPQSRMRETAMSPLSSATMASSSSWDTFWRCRIPAPTDSRSLSDSLGERRGSAEE